MYCTLPLILVYYARGKSRTVTLGSHILMPDVYMNVAPMTNIAPITKFHVRSKSLMNVNEIILRQEQAREGE